MLFVCIACLAFGCFILCATSQLRWSLVIYPRQSSLAVRFLRNELELGSMVAMVVMVVMVVYIFSRRQYAIRMQPCSRLQLAKTRFFLPSKWEWKIFHLSLAGWSTVVSKQQKVQIMFKKYFSTIFQ